MEDSEATDKWITDQLVAARVSVPVGNAIIALLETWGDLGFPNDEQRDKALELFVRLAKTEAIVEPSDERWVPAQAGFDLNVGDTVRVRSNYYTEPHLGRTHNGRVGRIVAKRFGDIIVDMTDGKLPELRSAHYPSQALDKKL